MGNGFRNTLIGIEGRQTDRVFLRDQGKTSIEAKPLKKSQAVFFDPSVFIVRMGDGPEYPIGQFASPDLSTTPHSCNPSVG
ncbi:hypothetical protein llap_3330 [Limosa lapponica baueri]|uniref:Uncharacterized protein n=1 Tax=Limosa lapponica baueri TaxID=1758121 RepID=A0A2I0UJX9_LIMLA|nr:hypothetical protein llap_3330 [Limosa lapponica baueri]